MTDDTFTCTRCWDDLPDTKRSTCLEDSVCERCHSERPCGPCQDERRWVA